MDQGMANLLLSWDSLEWNLRTLVIVGKKYNIKKERKTPEVCTCTFENKTHPTKSSWKMPEANCDSRVLLTLVSHADTLGSLLNPRVASFYKFFHDQCRNLPFGGRTTQRLTGASSKEGKCAESPPTFI